MAGTIHKFTIDIVKKSLKSNMNILLKSKQFKFIPDNVLLS